VSAAPRDPVPGPKPEHAQASAVPTASGLRRRGAVHDLGYQRYTGARRPQASRYRVISANLIASAWPGFWRYKAWLIAAAIISIVMATILYLISNNIIAALAAERLGRGISVAAILQPFAWQRYLQVAFVVSLSIGASVVSGDLRSGAFVFYFARPVRPVDYVLGKLGGLLVLNGLILIAAPLAVMLVNLGLSTGRDQILDNLRLVPRTLLVGAIATFAFSAIPLGFSAITPRRWAGVALWAAFYWVAGTMFVGAAFASRAPALAAVDITQALMAIVVDLFGTRHVEGPFFALRLLPPAWLGLTAIALYSAAGIGLAFYRVSAEERAGLGSST
jgi:hypothetical protein